MKKSNPCAREFPPESIKQFKDLTHEVRFNKPIRLVISMTAILVA